MGFSNSAVTINNVAATSLGKLYNDIQTQKIFPEGFILVYHSGSESERMQNYDFTVPVCFFNQLSNIWHCMFYFTCNDMKCVI